MNLIISDHPLVLTEKQEHSFEYIDLTKQNMHNCVGCFGCWTKTIGKCVIRDDAVKIYPLIAKSERVLYVSKLAYGGYDLPMKTLLEKAFPSSRHSFVCTKGKHITCSGQSSQKMQRSSLMEISQNERHPFSKN